MGKRMAVARIGLVVMIITIAIIAINCVSRDQQQANNSAIDPTSIGIIVSPDKILVGGDTSIVTAQLYYKEEPLRKKGVNITFTSDNDAIALPALKINSTDGAGSASMPLFSDVTPSRVKVTVTYNGSHGEVSNSTYINISTWGKLGGVVLNKTGIGIPYANVSLWTCHYNNSDHKWEIEDLLKIPGNPQQTNDGRTAPTGLFAFTRIPVGDYMVRAEKEGYDNSSIISINQGTVTCIITLSDYDKNILQYTPLKFTSPAVTGGTIRGIVCDDIRLGVPNANVSLWHCDYNQSTGMWEKTTMVDVPGNPQRAGDGRTGTVGRYQFDGLPQGTYYVTAYINENYADYKPYYAIVHLNDGLTNVFVVLPYQEQPILPPTPTPTSMPSPII